MQASENREKPAKPSWRARARLRAGLPPRTRGGQPGNRNRLVHGRYTGHYRARRAFNQRLIRETNALIALFELSAKLPLHLVEGARHREAMDRGRIAPRETPFTSTPSAQTSARPNLHLPLVGRSKIRERSDADFRVGGSHTHHPHPKRFAFRPPHKGEVEMSARRLVPSPKISKTHRNPWLYPARPGETP
jgi:hypothetical protein